ncbi:wax ester/triacylglycerol synthase domain-containing protein [Streptomyces pratensis]|uniref:wax ester/triacylglycerol synthase domain-containing protein n=1 Tax=Streptomyces pratensis TaxID=1169025 RepID=UPI003016F660
MRRMDQFPGPSPADLVMLRAEQRARHPDANMTVGAVLHLSGPPPDLAGLREHVTARLDTLPCLTHRVAGEGPTARWEAATPEMTWHVRSGQVGGGQEVLREVVGRLVREAWPEDAPAWRIVLLHGHVPDGFALLYLTHHAVQNGANTATVLETLFGPQPPGQEHSLLARGVPSAARPRARQVAHSAAVLLRGAGRHRLWQSAAHPLSSRRHLLWVHVPSGSLRAAARAGAASANDVYLTALAHAVAHWAREFWPRAARPTLPVLVPVNLRTPDEVAVPGNRVYPVRIDLPGSPMTVGERLARTRGLTRGLKAAGHKTVLRAAITRLPRRLLQRLVDVSTAPGRLTVCASNLVMRQRLDYGDAAVQRIDPIICCPPGVPLAVVAMTYGDTTSVCFRIDTALPGADTLPDRWRQAVADLTARATRTADRDPPPAGQGRSVVRSLVIRLARRSTAATARRS